MLVPSDTVSTIDCIDLEKFERISSISPKLGNANEIDRGLLMQIRAIDENYLMAAYENSVMAVHDLRTFQEVSSMKMFDANPVMCFDYV